MILKLRKLFSYISLLGFLQQSEQANKGQVPSCRRGEKVSRAFIRALIVQVLSMENQGLSSGLAGVIPVLAATAVS